VTLIMWVPMLGGGVAGMLLDGMLSTSPLFAGIGLLIGTLIAGAGIWAYVRARTSRS